MKRAIARIALALVPLALLATPSDAWAQGTGDLEGLLNESVVSTASKSSETASVAPGTSVVITAEDLRLFGVTRLNEALRYLPLGISVVDGGNIEFGVGVRGVRFARQGAHILWLLNGHRMNDPYAGSAAIDVPVELIDHIEIVLGPGSVLYGSNAMQAVINVITKDTSALSSVHVGVESRPLVTLRPWATAGKTFELFGSRGEITAGAQYYAEDSTELDYPRANMGIDPSTGQPYRYTSNPVGDGFWGGRATTAFKRGLAGVTRVSLGEFKLGLYAQTNRAPVALETSDFDSRLNRSIDRSLRIDLSHEHTISSVVHISERLYADHVDSKIGIQGSRGPTCTPGRTCVTEILGESQWAGTELQGRLDWLTNGTFVTTLGTDLSIRRVRSKTDVSDVATGNALLPSLGAFDRTTPLLAGYGQQTWSPFRWLDLNAGARLDYDSRFPAVVSPREAIRVAPWENGAFKLVHSAAFRAPTFRESDLSNPVVPVSENLKPERVRSFEASFEQSFGPHRVLFGVFDQTWDNLIEFRTLTAAESADLVARGKSSLPPIYQYRNVANVHTQGFNAAYEGSLRASRFKYALNITEAVAQEDAGPLAGSPTFFGNGRVSYDFRGDWPTLGLVTAFYGRTLVEGAIRGGYRPVPYAPAQVDFRLVAAGHIPHLRKLTYRAWVSYSVADRTPLAVGPVTSASPTHNAPLMAPIDQVRALVGLAYEF